MFGKAKGYLLVLEKEEDELRNKEEGKTLWEGGM